LGGFKKIGKGAFLPLHGKWSFRFFIRHEKFAPPPPTGWSFMKFGIYFS